jgi:hypothetical protein
MLEIKTQRSVGALIRGDRGNDLRGVVECGLIDHRSAPIQQANRGKGEVRKFRERRTRSRNIRIGTTLAFQETRNLG